MEITVALPGCSLLHWYPAGGRKEITYDGSGPQGGGNEACWQPAVSGSPHLQLAAPGMPVAFGRAAAGCYCWMLALRAVWEGELPYFRLQPACSGCPDALRLLLWVRKEEQISQCLLIGLGGSPWFSKEVIDYAVDCLSFLVLGWQRQRNSDDFWAEWDRERSCGPWLGDLHGKVRLLSRLSAVSQAVDCPKMDIYP